jgi:LysM repeat protein
VLQRIPQPGRGLAAALPFAAAFALVASLTAAPAAAAGSLQPTRAGLERQAAGARSHGFDHLQNAEQVHDFTRRGLLVTLRGNRDYYLHSGVRYGVARPEVKTFVERLASQYRASCGERLVVTSLTRPQDRQPRNSHALSVHPTGMALDLRISNDADCRRWIESALVELETKGVIEAARERNPPHYHVVVFPRQYAQYVSGRGSAADTVTAATTTAVAQRPAAPARAAQSTRYKVRSGDSLWTIARRHNTSVAALRRANGLRGTSLRPGQVLSLPAR